MNETASSASSAPAPAAAQAASQELSTGKAPAIDATPATPAFSAAASVTATTSVEVSRHPAPSPEQPIATIAELRHREASPPPTPQPALTPNGTEWVAAQREAEVSNSQRIAELRQQLGDADRNMNANREAALDRPAFNVANGFER